MFFIKKLVIISLVLFLFYSSLYYASNPDSIILDPIIQYNQSDSPYVAYGGSPSGDYNDLNVSGEGLTYNIPESIQTSQTSGRGWAIYTNKTASIVGRAIVRNWTGSEIRDGIGMGTDSGGARSWQKLRCLEKRQECILVWNDADNDISFEVYHTDTNVWSDYTELEGSANNDNTQNFDIECEDLSGECLIVYDGGTDNQQIAYRVYNNSGLNIEEILSIGPVAGLADWIRLYPKNNSNEMMLIVGDDNLDISVTLWNGTNNSFKTPYQIITQAEPLSDRKSFDFAWEGSSGDGLLAYGNTTDGVFGFTYINYVWTNIGLLYQNGARAYTIHMCGSNPLMDGTNHDYIGIMVNDQDQDLTGGVWDGSAIETNPAQPIENTAAEGNIPTENIQCMWETSSKNQAVFIWVDDGALTPEGGTYTIGTGWSFSNWASGDSTSMTTWQNDVEDLQLIPHSENDIMFVIGQDLDEDIECMRWMGNEWNATSCGLLESNAPSSLFESDTFDWDRYITTYYMIEVWHNSSEIADGNILSINTTINFTTNVSDYYSLQIYDFANSQWISAGCDSGNILADTSTKWWCNETSNPMNYNSSDRIIRIRINSTTDIDVGLLKEDYVQYYVGYQAARLEVQLINPPSSVDVIQNYTFPVNATIICRNGPCGEVTGTVRYNLSSSNPDTPVNTTFGDKPFFVQETPANVLKSCGVMYKDQSCQLNWTINATGDIDTSWKIGVLFNSSYPEIQENNTDNATISIVSCTVDIDAQWTSISFGLLDPSTGPYEAPGNLNSEYNITVKLGSCNSDLYIRGTNLVNETLSSVIGVGNVTWSNVSNSYSTSFNLTTSNEIVKLNVPQNTNVTTWYWINVPAVYDVFYNGTITITGVKSG